MIVLLMCYKVNKLSRKKKNRINWLHLYVMCIYPTMLVIFSQTFFPCFSLGVHVCMTVNTLAFKKKKKFLKLDLDFHGFLLHSIIFSPFSYLFSLQKVENGHKNVIHLILDSFDYKRSLPLIVNLFFRYWNAMSKLNLWFRVLRACLEVDLDNLLYIRVGGFGLPFFFFHCRLCSSGSKLF